MLLKAKRYDVDSARVRVVIHNDDCLELGIREGDRVSFGTAVAVASRSDTVVRRGHILIPRGVMDSMGLKNGREVDVRYTPRPDSVVSIKRKMDGGKLSKDEIDSIIRDIHLSHLSDIDMSAWVTALHIRGMDTKEIADMTVSMSETGGKVRFDRSPVFDFHSIGGVAGNKITPIIVSIVAAAGFLMPKLSSRAISSACGTADYVGTFCDVELDAERFKDVVESTGGSFAWGGATNIAKVGDMVAEIQRPLGIDPRPEALASIMSKKLSIGVTHLLIDIPTGAEVKAKNIGEARSYANDFIDLGRKLGIHVECAITCGDVPIGDAVGPILEARECIRVLEGDAAYSSVADKSCNLAGMMLEMGGMPNGTEIARRILSSGDALKKFREIVAAQNGDPNITSNDLVPGSFTAVVESPADGFVTEISNKAIIAVARAAGAPGDKGAGLIMLKKEGQSVSKGEPMIEIYADSESKCRYAKEVSECRCPMIVSGMILEKRSRPSVSERCDEERGCRLY